MGLGRGPTGVQVSVLGSSIRICWGKSQVIAELFDTPTAQKILNILPCESIASTWGEEVYFKLPVKVSLESDARQVVDPGTVCFWVEGQSLAIPFGATPISEEGECRLVTKVNLLGKLKGDPKALSSVHDGDRLRIEVKGKC